MKKAIFLDRDGTINLEKNYLYKIEEFEFLPGVIEALKMLQNNGFLLIIITNQSGIARGYYSEKDFDILNSWMLRTFAENGIMIDKVYYCPHHPNAIIPKYKIECNCRKPKLGMFEAAIEEFNLDIKKCYTIGDKIRDCSICKSTLCRGFLISNNEDPEVITAVQTGTIQNVKYASDLHEAAIKIVSENS